MQPAHAHLLIGPQRCPQRRARVECFQRLRAAQPLQRLHQPGTGHHLRPVHAGFRNDRRARRIGAREHPHGLPKTQALRRSGLVHPLKVLQRRRKLLAVDLDPLTSNQREPFGLGEQFSDLAGIKRLAVERDVHAEVQQRVRSELRGRRRAEGCRYLRSGRAP